MKKKVFLGGTTNNSKWRESIKPKLKIDYYDPVVPEWNDEAYKRELDEREKCDYCLYVITPKMTGFYSVAEVIDDSNKRPNKTIFCVLNKDDDKTFSDHQEKSLTAIGKMVVKNGGKWLKSIDEIADFLNENE
ncbi:MAG: nucleoside 2-deoxyribosyltransferase domain-containing protein [Bacteroidales bacterium]|nr:nucleoside 2-deoxyribosyltransferase domain-containing protein [Bacteroidales bacterium]